MAMRDALHWLDEPVDEAAGTAMLKHRGLATATALTRREELRDEIRRRSVRLGLQDALIAGGIGALGAVPATRIDDVVAKHLGDVPLLAPFRDPAGNLPSVREMGRLLAKGRGLPSITDIESLAASGREALPAFEPFVDRLKAGQVDALELGTRAADALTGPTDFAEAFLINAEDVLETGLVKLLTGWWVGRRGWEPGSQIFHEFKALAYGTTAAISLPYNPNPIATGLSAWHLVKAMLASRELTKLIVELSEVAIAEAAGVIAAWDAQVERNRGMGDLVGRATSTTTADPVADLRELHEQLDGI